MYYFGVLVANGPNVDERLKAARERREEQQKLLGMWTLSKCFLLRWTHTYNWFVYLYWLTIFSQRLGNWAGWRGSSGPGDIMSNNCSSVKRNSRSRGSKRRRGVPPWKRSASRDWRRRKWVLSVLLFLGTLSWLWMERRQHWRLFLSWIKERYESAVRRTLEKSQRVQQNPGQNSRGRKLTKNGE